MYYRARCIAALAAVTLVTLVQVRPSVQQGACKSDSHLLTTSMDECTVFCNEKIVGVEDKASVDPQIYEYEGASCCKCNYNRFAAQEETADEAYEAYEADEAYEAYEACEACDH